MDLISNSGDTWCNDMYDEQKKCDKLSFDMLETGDKVYILSGMSFIYKFV